MLNKNILKTKRVRQIGALYSSMIAGVMLGIVVSVLNTRILGPEAFGDFKYIHSIYSFFAIIIAFGYMVTTSKLLAEKKNNSIRKELIGSSLVICSILGFIFIAVMLLFSVIQKNFFATDLSSLIIMLAPLFFFIPFVSGLENIYQGENRIYELAIFRLAPQVLYILAVAILFKYGQINLETALITQFALFGLTIIISVFYLKPSLSNLKNTVRLISKDNKLYGFNVYIGSVIGVATTQLGPIAISYFSENNTDVGFFSLAVTITMPLALIPTVVGTSMFKEFANRNEVSAKATQITILVSVLSLILFLIFIKPLVGFLFSKDFTGSVKLAYIVSIGQIFHGFGNYYNRFLGSKGHGKYLRNGAIIVGIINLTGYIFLVPIYGAYGASWTKLLSGLTFVCSMLYYYKKYTNTVFRKNNH
jgi:O-antigen/teichoic acid export membrane protein